MIVNDNDRVILRYLEKWDYITASQATYLLGRKTEGQKKYILKRLNFLADNGYIVKNDFPRNFFGDNKENIYSSKKLKEYPNQHTLILMSYICYLHGFFKGIEVIGREFDWKPIKVKSDALICFKYRGSYYYQIVEVVNSTHVDNFYKYLELYKANIFQDMVEAEIFPLIVVIDNRHRRFDYEKYKPLQFVFLDKNFNGFDKILQLL